MLLLAIVLGVAVLLDIGRWLRLRKQPAVPAQRRDAARRCMAAIAAALLLAWIVFAPNAQTQNQPAVSRLVVLTPGAADSGANRAARGGSTRLIRLDSAPASADVRVVPDLATALRWWPDTTRVDVVGAGLSERDLHQAGDLLGDWYPAEWPAPVVRWPTTIRAGQVFDISGRWPNAAPDSTIRLAAADFGELGRGPIDADGLFAVSAVAPNAGLVALDLELLKPDGSWQPLSSARVFVLSAAPVRIGLVAAAPGPEVAALRRTLDRAGVLAAFSIGISPKRRLASVADLNEAEPLPLADLDGVVIDERSLRGASDAWRAALTGALESGLGVVLRPDIAEPARPGFSFARVELAADAQRSIERGDAKATAPPSGSRRPEPGRSRLDGVIANGGVPGAPVISQSAERIGTIFPRGAGRLLVVEATNRQLASDARFWAEALGSVLPPTEPAATFSAAAVEQGGHIRIDFGAADAARDWRWRRPAGATGPLPDAGPDGQLSLWPTEAGRHIFAEVPKSAAAVAGERSNGQPATLELEVLTIDSREDRLARHRRMLTSGATLKIAADSGPSTQRAFADQELPAGRLASEDLRRWLAGLLLIALTIAWSAVGGTKTRVLRGA